MLPAGRFASRLRRERISRSARSGYRGKAEAEARAGGRRFARQVAVVLLCDAARDGEAEAVARFIGIESDVTFEDALAFVCGYARTVV